MCVKFSTMSNHLFFERIHREKYYKKIFLSKKNIETNRKTISRKKN